MSETREDPLAAEQRGCWYFVSLSVLVTLLLGVSPTLLFAQQQCRCAPDSSVRPASGDRSGYQNKGDRCEGLVLQLVAPVTLQVVSFIESIDTFPGAGETLRVEWSAPVRHQNPVQLRVETLPSGVSYRMDTRCPTNPPLFAWSMELLAQLRIRPSEITVAAMTTHRVGDSEEEVLLPVTIASRSPRSLSPDYLLTVMPFRELSEVFFRATPVDNPTPTVEKYVPLRRGYYPPLVPIVIRIPKAKTSGVYSVQIGATVRAGAALATEVLIYNAGQK